MNDINNLFQKGLQGSLTPEDIDKHELEQAYKDIEKEHRTIINSSKTTQDNIISVKVKDNTPSINKNKKRGMSNKSESPLTNPKIKQYICCLCNKKIIGYGNNPEPLVKEGRCCDDCNIKVIEVRLKRFKNSEVNLK